MCWPFDYYSGLVLSVALTGAVARIILEQVGFTRSAQTPPQHVRFWPLADMPLPPRNVRFWSKAHMSFCCRECSLATQSEHYQVMKLVGRDTGIEI
jgi:hypothetical protein